MSPPPLYMIIGTGCVGLSIGRSLLRRSSRLSSPISLLLVDSGPTISTSTTSRSSGVIHAGIYYPKNTNKHRLCTLGKTLLTEYCLDNHVPLDNCGKLIVDPDGDGSVLRRLMGVAGSNGVPGVSMHGPGEVGRELGERGVRARGASRRRSTHPMAIPPPTVFSSPLPRKSPRAVSMSSPPRPALP